ncbi:MAG: MerC family mercury resistance protein [Pseudomonadota bacterium]|uniref:MerC family mercury resistance protein n=1 Tax=Roseovarius TaxID=74030 RepID=UPI0022A67591|nr:MerC family mercury resistance protein [Roseovarius sp. EGI FJ00037]MCZ0811426.1 MerC family mercury resistance protein [Roseovarius sp. EGI FJ00037]
MKRGNGSAASPDWAGLAASALALVSCYGTLAVVITLSAAGITLTLDETIWAVVIALITLVAVVAVAFGTRRHGKMMPTLLAAAGFGVVLWVQFVDYSLMVEIAGFATLVVAAAWDWRLRLAGA